jgi:hypothetical protein
MEGLSRMEVGGERFRERVARKNVNKGKSGADVYASQGRMYLGKQRKTRDLPVARKNVNKGKHETFQARRREEECKRRETRDLRSGRGALRPSDIIEGKKRIYIPL